MNAPAALAEPTVRVRPGWTSLLFLANLGLWLAVYAPIQVLLPRQAELLDQANKTVVLSVVMGVGALAALVANPVIGMLSDRTTSSWGRRHPWTLLGAVVGLLGLVVLAFAPNVALMVVGWAITQIGLNGMLAALTSALPDRVPVAQRAEIGGYVGISQMLGTVIGALLVTVLVTGLISGYIACGLVAVAFALLFVLRTHDERLPVELRPTGGLVTGLRNLWISPRQHPDFGWGWATHFLVNLGNALGTLYLLFFLDDVVHYQPDPQDGLLILMAIYGVALIIGAVVFGIVSDRTGKRKQYVVLSAIVMALAALLLVIWPTWGSALLAAPLLGFGFGIYWAVALAILTEVLPSAGDRAKDLGVINIANSLPQVAAPVLAGLVLKASAGYSLLFLLSALVTLGGGVVVTRIKSVR
ncbi:MFS transporter [Labedaea rhizosphaerae]|uniref:MFS transporter n=1 Tax=Labedaea rhizosphaerae TaxID=598644 RepID=A0A4R6SMB7_LABRH|nr:MFS transporter [Labedaea rhizosphaerae]TDQ05127.1 MFS transporter [Labedaea rhizosphaerae]